MSSHAPLVSIIINNYNYGQYLASTIESALHQNYSNIELLVVDDGSSDDSRQVICRYRAQVIPVLKENGGQGSAVNAGFAKSSGELVIFLDSDDLLHPDIVARVVEAWQSNPEAVIIRYALEWMDASGTPIGLLKPCRPTRMLSGDLRQQVLSAPEDLFWQSMSGNAFTARVLREVMPVPEHSYRFGADHYLVYTSALFGSVISLEACGGYYRIHSSNTSKTSPKVLRMLLERYPTLDRHVQQFASSLGLQCTPKDQTIRRLAIRLASLKLDPTEHPIKDDKSAKLAWAGVRAAFRRANWPLSLRTFYALWFVGTWLAPRSVAYWLADKYFHPYSRRRFTTTLRFTAVLDRPHAPIHDSDVTLSFPP